MLASISGPDGVKSLAHDADGLRADAAVVGCSTPTHDIWARPQTLRVAPGRRAELRSTEDVLFLAALRVPR
jgi:hypothetical protein